MTDERDPNDRRDELLEDIEKSRADRDQPADDPPEPEPLTVDDTATDGGATTIDRAGATQRRQEAYLEFLRVYHRDDIAELAQRYPKDQRALELDWRELQQGYTEAADSFLEEPRLVLEELSDAVAAFDLPADVDLSEVEIQVTNLPPHRQYDVGLYSPKRLIGDVVELRGQVSKRLDKKPIYEEAAFICERCGTTSYVPQTGDEFLDEPNQCQGCERDGPYTVSEEDSTLADYQLLRLKQPPEMTRGTAGESIDIQVRDELVDVAEPGDRIRVTATIHCRQEKKGQRNKRTGEIYARAHGIILEEHDWNEVDIESHRDEIEAIANSGDAFERIVDSVYPSHYGDRRVKEAMALQMFGGVDKQLEDDRTRGTIHIGLIGDPSTNKSGLLQYAEKMSPRSIFTSGKGTTSTGLTAAAVQDDFGDGGWTIEAGAVVQADGGLCCIDELDKMDEEDQNGLLEAMSNQKVSFAKAGKEGQLPANTSILAAANPKSGRFDMYQPIPDQFDFHPALISRFDLLFTFTDEPDREKDEALARHKTDSAIVAQKKAAGMQLDEDEAPAVEPDITPEVMRAYIAMGRRVTPVFTEEARRKIEEDYVGMRTAYEDSEEDPPMPITARKLDALIRLAEASARMRLSDYIELEDAERALRVHKACLEDVGIDPETGQFDADRVEAGSSKSQRKRRMKLENVVEELASQSDSGGADYETVVEVMEEQGYEEDQVRFDIEHHYKENGKMYEPADGELLLT